jgi:catechol 2,3-dioxygenase-like lactoylglutathione lyase family enzyme
VRLDLTAILVDDYDEAIAFFVHALGFDLAEDQPATSGDGRPKRWVVVRPPAGGPAQSIGGRACCSSSICAITILMNSSASSFMPPATPP